MLCMSKSDLSKFCALSLAFVMLSGADWPRFRGPNGSGVAESQKVPEKWDDGQNVVWKKELPGFGTSSPVVWKDSIFLSCYSGYGLDQKKPGNPDELKRHVLCLDRKTGEVAWQQEVTQQLPDRPYEGFQALHGFASSTPTTDGQQVFFFFGKSGVCAYSLDGKLNWQVDVGNSTHNWGSATSPVLYKDLVIINASVESGSLVALKKSDGSPAWKVPGMRSSWNTPVLVQAGDRDELVISIKGNLLAFHPETGDELWTCKGIDDYVCPSVVAHEGVVYAIGGRSNTAVAVKAGGSGDVSKSHLLWSIDRGSNVSSPVVHNGHLYWVSEGRGVAYCANTTDGKMVYEQRLDPRPDRFYASPVVVDGKIFYMSRTTGCYVLAAEPQYKLLSHNKFSSDTSVFNASPAIVNGQIFLRSDKFLYCIGAK